MIADTKCPTVCVYPWQVYYSNINFFPHPHCFPNFFPDPPFGPIVGSVQVRPLLHQVRHDHGRGRLIHRQIDTHGQVRRIPKYFLMKQLK